MHSLERKERKMKLEIRNLSTKRRCKTEQMGSIYISKCDKFSHVFKEGICFIAGEIYEGGWSVTDFLSRKDEGDGSGVEICWNGENCSVEDIRETVYYVTDNCGNYERNGRTVEENLKEAFQLGKLDMDYETFVSMCELREMRTWDRSMNQTGHAFWFYSALIGLALGKKIVTFPWISRREMETQSYRFNLLAQLSWELDCIVIIPVETSGSINKNNLPKDLKWYEVINMERGRKWN